MKFQLSAVAILFVMTMNSASLADSADSVPVRDLTEQTNYADNQSNQADSPVLSPANQSIQQGVTGQETDTQSESLSSPGVAVQSSSPAVMQAPSLSTQGESVQASPSFLGQLTLDQRITRLEAQMNNFVKMDLPARLDDLQQQIQSLTGQLQVVQHDLKLLNQQQRVFYKDLDQRIKQAQNLSGNGDEDADNHVSPPASKSPSTEPTSSSSINEKDSAAYQKAFDALKKKQFDQAESAFNAYLSNFPNGQYAANAHYWLGELYLLDKNLKSAGDEFNTVMTKYSSSSKFRDACLKVAIVHASMGQEELAKKELSLLKQKYPGSTVAQLASIQLQQLGE